MGGPKPRKRRVTLGLIFSLPPRTGQPPSINSCPIVPHVLNCLEKFINWSGVLVMSRWTWMESIVWVGAIAALSSISHSPSDFQASRQSDLNSASLPPGMVSPQCDRPERELLPFSWINFPQKFPSESGCESLLDKTKLYSLSSL